VGLRVAKKVFELKELFCKYQDILAEIDLTENGENELDRHILSVRRTLYTAATANVSNSELDSRNAQIPPRRQARSVHVSHQHVRPSRDTASVAARKSARHGGTAHAVQGAASSPAMPPAHPIRYVCSQSGCTRGFDKPVTVLHNMKQHVLTNAQHGGPVYSDQQVRAAAVPL
jgi:hypothetical protein